MRITEMSLKVSEIKKAVKAFKKETGIDAFVAGYGYTFDKDFIDVTIEMDDNETGRRAGTVYMTVVMFDRRRTWVSAVEEC